MTTERRRTDLGPPPEAAVDTRQRTGADLPELQSMIDGLSAQVALVRCGGIIAKINRQWRTEIRRQGNWDFDIGCDYADALAGLVASGDVRVAPVLQAFRDVSQGVRRSFGCVYFGSGRFAGHDYRVSISALQFADDKFVIVSVEDISELNALRRQRRRTDTRVLRAQEDERRRIARELHDSTSQTLVVLDMNLIDLRKQVGPDATALIDECKNTVKEIQREIRSLSFMAHPPSLPEHDLGSAFMRLTAGFQARTGLEIRLELSSVGEASPSVEAALYRIAQEALSNIHRHARAAAAEIRLTGTARWLHLLIMDDGVGFDLVDASAEIGMGVGVLGMRERVRELGGLFSIGRATKGTRLCVALPRTKADVPVQMHR